ncbi:MAG TPA: DUF3108 domain-containing protein [Gammaproteobacteria bacterium]|nr:DUF3108 domain-containing protein [Gammaproteobacteria bacterium]
MSQKRKCRAIVTWILLLWVNTALAISFEGETLTFQAYYQGLFSAQKKLGIADVLWKTQRLELMAPEKTIIETRMDVSSQAYDFVESLYPFRLVYRSLVSLEPMTSIAYEVYDSTDKHGKELIWLNAESGLALRFRDGYEDRQDTDINLPGEIADWGSQQQGYQFYKRAEYKVLPQMVDKMALLQRVRGETLSVGTQLEIPVFDGKRQYLYKVSVVGSDTLTLLNRNWDALKIRFDGYRIKHGKSKQDHDTVWVWLANSAQRTPLRFEHRAAIGQFVIELQALGSRESVSSRNHYTETVN